MLSVTRVENQGHDVTETDPNAPPPQPLLTVNFHLNSHSRIPSDDDDLVR